MITIQHIDGCPNVQAATQHVREALQRLRSDATITLRLVKDKRDAQELGFIGSPTILIDGRDPFSVAGSDAALACRIYQTEGGLEGLPSVEQLCEALLLALRTHDHGV